jgi:hypothetical protein
MSRYVAALVYRKKVGSMARKSILAYCAERANDDGSGVWASKVRIAKEVECSKQTVIDTLKSFVDEGLMKEVGKRRSPHGYTIEYAILVRAVEALEDAFEDPFSTDDARGPNLDGSTHLTPRGQATGPQEVKPVDPNRPLTVPKPSNTRDAREDDLFSADDQTESQADGPDQIEEGFKEFWAEIWPSHKRKAGKSDCEKVYRSACVGQHKKADQIDPPELNRCARAYITSVRDLEYLKAPLAWLRQPGWEPFMRSGSEQQFNHSDLTSQQEIMLRDGRVPPSMTDDDGNPNAAARYWLKKFGGRAA